MKNQAWFYFVLGLLSLVIVILWRRSLIQQENLTVFNATITRDCAPWDGAAFTVSIPFDQGTNVMISIWQSPDVKFPVEFSFPDETGRVGFAYSLSQLDPLQPLSGRVSFTRIVEGSPVNGEFNFNADNGSQYKGRFIANWINTFAMCG